jgi:hypothetical protein
MRRLLAIAAIAIVGSSASARAAGLPRGDPLQRLRAEGSQAAQPDPSRRAGIVWVALGSGAMLLVVLTAVQTKRPLRLARVGAQSPEGGAHMRRRLNEREDGGAEQVEEAEAGAQGFAELGQHVATVLATAREAAEKIEDDARREAVAVLERAKVEAAETLSDARDKAAAIEQETNEKRSAAIAAAEDIRSRADAYAEQKRQEADEAARDRARAAEERQQELEANVERTEERLRKLVAGLRELAGRLDVLMGADAPGEAEADLDEALKRQAAQPVEVEAGRDGQEA